MNCDEVRAYLHAYADGELELMASVEAERHLQECADCRAALADIRALSTGLRHESLRAGAPGRLGKNVRAAVRREARGANRNPKIDWRWLSAPLAVAAALVIAVVIPRHATRPNDVVADEVLQSHVRSLMPNHLEDVISTDQHTVKPWFNGRLDFSPPVQDFARDGFPLVGGRLDYIANRPVAALVYQHRKHIINVFVWPEKTVSGRENPLTLQGYHLLHWDKDGMTFWAASDVNAADLQTFEELLRRSG